MTLLHPERGVSEQVKRCGSCRIEKPLSDFWNCRSAKDGKQGRCIECQRAHKRGPGKYQSGLAAWTYGLAKLGITPDEYQEMLERQGAVCAICKQDDGDRRLAVDHCHATGRIRGLLCRSCNLALGHLKDDPERVAAALGYLSA